MGLGVGRPGATWLQGADPGLAVYDSGLLPGQLAGAAIGGDHRRSGDSLRLKFGLTATHKGVYLLGDG